MNFKKIPAFKNNHIFVVIETPKGSRNKYRYNSELEVMTLKSVLPEGYAFPFDFGFIPNTLVEDGDPIDVLMLFAAPMEMGCVVESRAIGAITAVQTEGSKKIRNDRILAIPLADEKYETIASIEDLDSELLRQLEHFLASYNQLKGKKFSPLSRLNSLEAMELIRKAVLK